MTENFLYTLSFQFVNRSFNCEQFFVRKRYFSLFRASFKSLCSNKTFLLLDRLEVYSIFLILTESSWISFLVILLIEVHTHIHVFSHLSYRSLRIPPYLSRTALVINFDQAVRGLSLLWRSSDVPSYLNLFTHSKLRIWVGVRIAQRHFSTE